MKRINTPDGRFASGDPVTRKPGTLVTSTWMNDLQDEICNVIELAGLTLAENDQTQLHTAIGNMIAAQNYDGLYAPIGHTHTAAEVGAKATDWIPDIDQDTAGTLPLSRIGDVTPTGQALLTADDQAAARAAIGPMHINNETTGLLSYARLASPAAQAVGAWVIAHAVSGYSCAPGNTIAGGQLRHVLMRFGNGAWADPNLISSSLALPGTWRNMGGETVSGTITALFIRIA